MNRGQMDKQALDRWIEREDPKLSEDVCHHTEGDTECDDCLAFEVEDQPIIELPPEIRTPFSPKSIYEVKGPPTWMCEACGWETWSGTDYDPCRGIGGHEDPPLGHPI